uniref:Uncharacterized protein n=1 Tax=Aeromonas salmonicida subsp. salmonicida TaxID=29491 RepID=A0A1I9S1X8_AERSS|nr:putative hypothetical protein [Aeromonas salmonicida subsp. salmonicida]
MIGEQAVMHITVRTHPLHSSHFVLTGDHPTSSSA